LNALLVALVKPLPVAAIVYPAPALPMAQPEKIATPDDAFNGLLEQVSVPPLGFVAIASVILALLPAAGLSNWSSTLTIGCVVQAVPPVPPPGCVVNISFDAAALFTVKFVLVALLRAPSVAFKVNDPALVGTIFENVAMPLLAATLSVELAASTPPELIPIDTVEVSVVTVLPFESSIKTATAGLIAKPAVVVEG
jgi:hypothetical protein